MNATQTLEIFKLQISRDDFQKAPRAEKIFYVRSMNFLTDLAINQKHLLFTMMKKSDQPIKMSAEHVQSNYFIRSLSGLLYEGWGLIREGFFEKKLGVQYEIKELENLKKYFGQSENIIKKIRHNFSNHLDLKLVEKELENLEDYPEFDIYLTEDHGNCFYLVGEHIHLTALMKSAGKNDLGQNYDDILEDVTNITKVMQAFFGNFMRDFHRKHLGVKSIEDLEKLILDVPGLSEVKAPFFVKRDF